MRFLIDMGISVGAAKALRTQGHDTLHLREQALHELSDREILAMARLEKRIVLTHDLDFSHILALGGHATPSVITFRLTDMRADNVSLHLADALKQFAEELKRGAAVSIGDRTSRCHTLPITPGG